MPSPRHAALPALCLLAASATAWMGCRTAEAVGRAALRTTPGGRRILGEFDRYHRIASTLKKYHDSGELGEEDVFTILKAAGVVRPSVPSPRRGSKPAPAPEAKPFPVPVYAGNWRWPLEAGIVSSEFGPRWGKMHKGLDLAADMGVPVYAAAPGEVLYSGDQLTGYGNVVMLRHDQKTTSLYAHNKSLLVKTGEKIQRGQLIARLGSTGRSTGPHVHFEILVQKQAVNPRKRLPKSRF